LAVANVLISVFSERTLPGFVTLMILTQKEKARARETMRCTFAFAKDGMPYGP
jgi:hypothetical protein